MPSYQLNRDGLFYVKEDAASECLVSFWDYYANLGARPLHAFYESSHEILPDIIARLFGCYGVLAGEARSNDGELCCAIALAALFRQSMRGYRPLRVFLAGDAQGVLTALLTLAAREAHPEGCVYALLPGNNNATALGRLGEARANLKILAGDFELAILRDRWFDIAVLHGGQSAGDAGMAARLPRVIRPGGNLICLTGGDARLRDSILALPGAVPAEYGLTAGGSVFVKTVAAGDRAEPLGPREAMREILNALRDLVCGENEVPPLRLHTIVALLTAMEPHAIALFDVNDIELKQRVVDAKENALNCLYAKDAAFRESQMERLRAFAMAEQ